MEQTIDKRAEMMGTAKVPGAIVKLAVPAIVSMVRRVTSVRRQFQSICRLCF